MQIIIRKGAKAEDIKKALEQLRHSSKIGSLLAFAGKLKDVYGDGLEYQKNLRNRCENF